MPLPDKFNGDPCGLQGFINQCLVIWLFLWMYASDTARVGLIIGLVTGDGLAWVSVLLKLSSPLLDSVEAFIEAVARMFGDLHQVYMAEQALHMLRQGHCSVSFYATEFRCLAAYTALKEAAQHLEFLLVALFQSNNRMLS